MTGWGKGVRLSDEPPYSDRHTVARVNFHEFRNHPHTDPAGPYCAAQVVCTCGSGWCGNGFGRAGAKRVALGFYERVHLTASLGAQLALFPVVA